jgi:hypothetical protein
MVAETVTPRLPDTLYRRLANNARATRRFLEDVVLYALQVGSPPDWEDAPAEFTSSSNYLFGANRFSISFEVFEIDKPASAVQRKAEGSILPTSSMA